LVLTTAYQPTNKQVPIKHELPVTTVYVHLTTSYVETIMNKCGSPLTNHPITNEG